MPILFVVKPSRRRLYEALRRLVARRGLVGVVLERRRRARGPASPGGVERGFTLRQPLDFDSARTWRGLGFVVVRVRALPAERPVPGAPTVAGRPGRRAGAPRPR